MKRAKTANVAAFVATLMKAVTGSGAPSKTSGVHVWNGTRLSLKTSPIRNMPEPVQNKGLYANAGFTKSASLTLPVAPKSSAEPKSKNPVAVELRIKYFSADSRAVVRSDAAHSA